MFKKILWLVLISVSVACAAPAPTPTGPKAIPGATLEVEPTVETTPLPVNLTPAQGAVFRAVNQAVGLNFDQIKLVSTEAIDWPNGCLGTQQTGVQCTQAIVPGFRIIVEGGGKRYEYHTNNDGSSVVLAVNTSPFVQVAVRAADNTLQLFDTPLLLDRAGGLHDSGLLPHGGTVSDTLYALDTSTSSRVVVLEAGQQRTLDFIQNPSYGLAVLSGDSVTPARLSWGTSPTGDNTPTRLMVSAPDGSDLTTLVEENVTAPAYQIVAQRWSADAQAIYFSKEPYGIGGYIPFAGASSLYRVDLADKRVTELIPFNPNGGRLTCLDDVSNDVRLVANHCDLTSISILDLGKDDSLKIVAPNEVRGNRVGSARFSADTSRVAFAIARGDPANEQGWVAVSDSLIGGSQLIMSSNPGEYLQVVLWLDAETLLVQSNGVACNPACANSLWTVRIDGTQLTKVADGTFVAIVKP